MKAHPSLTATEIVLCVVAIRLATLVLLGIADLARPARTSIADPTSRGRGVSVEIRAERPAPPIDDASLRDLRLHD